MIAGVPYDAEVEYLTIPQDSYIETGIAYDAGYSTIELSGIFYGRNAILGQIINDSCPYFTVLGLIENGTNYLRLTTQTAKTTASLTSTTYGQEVTLTITKLGSHEGIPASGSRLLIGKARNWDYATKQVTSISGTHNPLSRYKGIVVRKDGAVVQKYIPVRQGNRGFYYETISRKLYDTNDGSPMGVGPDVATPVMGLRRYPQSHLGKMGARHMIYGGN